MHNDAHPLLRSMHALAHRHGQPVYGSHSIFNLCTVCHVSLCALSDARGLLCVSITTNKKAVPFGTLFALFGNRYWRTAYAVGAHALRVTQHQRQVIIILQSRRVIYILSTMWLLIKLIYWYGSHIFGLISQLLLGGHCTLPHHTGRHTIVSAIPYVL